MTKSDPLGSLYPNVFRFCANYITRSIFAGVVVYACWIPVENYSWFSWHVILCTLGLFPLMGEAFILFFGDELWSRQMSRKDKYFIHGFLALSGTILLTAGSAVVINKTESGEHYNTTHGLTGLISMILLIVSILVGLLTSYSTVLPKYISPVSLKFLHNSLGLLGYVIGIVSLCYSYYTNWFVYYTTPESRIVALVVTILATWWSITGALQSGYNQLRTIVNNSMRCQSSN